MLFLRKQLEDIEHRTLAPYGMRSMNTRGRHHSDKEPVYRTVFQRDRDRILHTTSFRRLEYKTQVFINFEGDYFRTRLTHTLEVAQIGRTIARAIGANEDLVEAVCLAHDLGHAAFGHSGEVVLDKLMENHGGFDHNKQSLRIVTHLEERYPDFPGLNLSWEVLEGMVKHETEYDVSDASGYDPHLRGNLEAQIANAADELAYTTHDLDDGLRSGMITPAMLADIPLWQELIEKVGWTGPELSDVERHRLIRKLVGIEVTDLVENTAQEIQSSGVQSVEEVQKLDRSLIGFSESQAQKNRTLKQFLYKKLYRHHRVVRMAVKAERVITELFNAYLEEQEMLPAKVQNRIEEKGLHRTICDYIAGMTDRYAIEEHQKIYNPLHRP